MEVPPFREETRIYRYAYYIESRFSPPVGYQFFKVRVLPLQLPHQLVTAHSLITLPPCRLQSATDVWGNGLQYGGYESLHDHFFLVSEGMVCCREYHISDVSPSPLYAAPSPLTASDGGMQRVFAQWKQEYCTSPNEGPAASDTLLRRRRLALSVMHFTHRLLRYQRGITDCSTTAAQALALGRGVCQDYAHVMIALCRLLGLHARYACGLVIGEGETHAWVEVHDGLLWHAYDPTRDRQVLWDYILLAHGRDASDCPLNRGHLYQFTQERLFVSAKVEELTAHN